MIRAGVLGPGDVMRLAPWCRLPRASYPPSIVVVLFAVVVSDTTVERYIFEHRGTDGIREMALQGVMLHSAKEPWGVEAGATDRRVYWPPLDVVQAALLAARSAR